MRKKEYIKRKIICSYRTLPSLKRLETKKIILDNGGKVASGFSKSADFVLAGNDAGEKLTMAKEFGMKIISEDEFIGMINKKDNHQISSNQKLNN